MPERSNSSAPQYFRVKAKIDRSPGNFDTSPDLVNHRKAAGVHDSAIKCQLDRVRYPRHPSGELPYPLLSALTVPGQTLSRYTVTSHIAAPICAAGNPGGF